MAGFKSVFSVNNISDVRGAKFKGGRGLFVIIISGIAIKYNRNILLELQLQRKIKINKQVLIITNINCHLSCCLNIYL